MVHDVSTNKINSTYYGSIIRQCRTLSDMYDKFKVVLARRSTNCNVHSLAFLAMYNANHNIFRCIFYWYISSIIMNEIT